MLRAHSFRARRRRAPPSCFRATAPPLLRADFFGSGRTFTDMTACPSRDTPMRQRSLAVSTRSRRRCSRKGRKPIFGRRIPAVWPLDQQPRFWPVSARRIRVGNKEAEPRSAGGQMLGRPLPPRDRAPSRYGRPKASSLTAIGRCLSSRRNSFGGRPRPDHFLGCSGPVPDPQTDVCGMMPAT